MIRLLQKKWKKQCIRLCIINLLDVQKSKNSQKEIDPKAHIGTMIAEGCVYPKTCNPKDIVGAMKRNRVQEYFFTDTQLRGEYPTYMLRHFEEKGIHIHFEDGDEELLKIIRWIS